MTLPSKLSVLIMSYSVNYLNRYFSPSNLTAHQPHTIIFKIYTTTVNHHDIDVKRSSIKKIAIKMLFVFSCVNYFPLIDSNDLFN